MQMFFNDYTGDVTVFLGFTELRHKVLLLNFQFFRKELIWKDIGIRKIRIFLFKLKLAFVTRQHNPNKR